ncbi:MAG: 3'-5' exonuclease [Oscillospiraceae bacterium]|nr:3'-5' exonuclease [Oscillospiraceae bacterium]
MDNIKSAQAFNNKLNTDVLQSLRKKYIAFDVETTGLNSYSDRIIEIGAVLFENGQPVKKFSTLVNPNVKVNPAAAAVNHITDAMLADAPGEELVYSKFMVFLGEAVQGNIFMCAHNARFDFGFLCNTLNRLGHKAYFNYVDTLGLSRKYVKGLDNYRQSTLEEHFGLVNKNSHRADADAINCGKILGFIVRGIDGSCLK